MTFAEQVKPILTEVLDNLRDAIRQTFKDQGHHLTGAWEESLEFTFDEGPGFLEGTMKANFYGGILEFGVKASRIPYTQGGKRGGKSLYIQGLINYFQKRGLNVKVATRASFATASKHKKEGLSTKASSRFSKTGRRHGFINEAIQAALPGIAETIGARYSTQFQLEFGKMLSQYPGITIR